MTDKQLRDQFYFTKGIFEIDKAQPWTRARPGTPSFTVWLNLTGLMETWYFVAHND